MAEDDALTAAKEALNKANSELKDLLAKWPDQLQKLKDLLGMGNIPAEDQLHNLTIPDGIKEEVVEAYQKMADIAANSPPNLERGWVHGLDPEGYQAIRQQILNQALPLIQQSGGVVAGGIASIAAWWASLSAAAVVSLIAISLGLIVGGLYLTFKGPSEAHGQSSVQQATTEMTIDIARCPSLPTDTYPDTVYGRDVGTPAVCAIHTRNENCHNTLVEKHQTTACQSGSGYWTCREAEDKATQKEFGECTHSECGASYLQCYDKCRDPKNRTPQAGLRFDGRLLGTSIPVCEVVCIRKLNACNGFGDVP
jgi:hypothetical protein